MSILLAAQAAASDDAPSRVVSINLCTDQLAMLLAAPGQLHSVSRMARDPRSSAMAERAKDFPVNHARAEEVYLMRPDLVLAGQFTAPATRNMLERLGVPVLVLPPAYTLDDIRDRLRAVGAALGRTAQADRLIADFDARLNALARVEGPHPTAALYQANGYLSGARSLSGEILSAAGFANVAADLGIESGGHVPLELLALAAPDAVITARRNKGAARAEELYDHPVLTALRAGRASPIMTDRDWVCGTPHILRAIARLAEARPR